MKNTANDPKLFSSKLVPLLALALVVIAISVTLAFREDLPPSVKPQTVLQTATPTAVPSVNFDREIAALIGAPRSYTPSAAKALVVRDAIKGGDFAFVDKAIKESLQQSRTQDWQMRPFNRLITRVLQRNDDAILNRLNEWAARDKDSAVPYLLRAQYHFDTGRLVRGERFSAEVQAGHMDSFQAHMEHATADVEEAIRRDGADPYATHLWLRILSAQGNTPEMESAFQQAIRKFPDYYPLYLTRLHSLSPKWGGSPKKMYAFVDTYADAGDSYSSLKLLYLQLYDNLLDAAWITCNDEEGEALSRMYRPRHESTRYQKTGS